MTIGLLVTQPTLLSFYCGNVSYKLNFKLQPNLAYFPFSCGDWKHVPWNHFFRNGRCHPCEQQYCRALHIQMCETGQSTGSIPLRKSQQMYRGLNIHRGRAVIKNTFPQW